MTNNRSVTNADIYDRLERLRLEVTKRIDDTSKEHKAELTDLRRQFETLEAGRLTRLEGRMSDFEVSQARKDAALGKQQAVMSTKFLIIWSLAGALAVAFLTAFAYRILVGRSK